LAGTLAYLPCENGKVYVFALADKANSPGGGAGLLATCNLGEPLYATPTFADGKIYFRGKANLFCIGAADSLSGGAEKK
jgi:hypothetical protein